MTWPFAVAVAVLVGLVVAAGTPILLRRLPEPELTADDPDDVKIPYADLATRRFAAILGAVAVPAIALPAAVLPLSLLPLWLVLGTLGLLLAAVDARTTWLPLPLTRLAWLAMATAVIAGLLIGDPGPAGRIVGDPSQAIRGVAGFFLAGALFYAAWAITRGGFGFGDVRFAPLVGAATAAVSWSMLGWALVLGSLVGAVVGLLRLARGRKGAFAYAPSILAGGYLAVTVAALST